MDGVTVALEASEEAEGEEADEQTHQRKQDAHPCNDVQEHFVNRVCVLQRNENRSCSAASRGNGKYNSSICNPNKISRD